MFDPQVFKLDGQVAVVTGAAAGIGRAIACTFAAAGAAVTVSDRDAPASAALVDEIVASGGKAISVPCEGSGRTRRGR